MASTRRPRERSLSRSRPRRKRNDADADSDSGSPLSCNSAASSRSPGRIGHFQGGDRSSASSRSPGASRRRPHRTSARSRDGDRSHDSGSASRSSERHNMNAPPRERRSYGSTFSHATGRSQRRSGPNSPSYSINALFPDARHGEERRSTQSLRTSTLHAEEDSDDDDSLIRAVSLMSREEHEAPPAAPVLDVLDVVVNGTSRRYSSPRSRRDRGSRTSSPAGRVSTGSAHVYARPRAAARSRVAFGSDDRRSPSRDGSSGKNVRAPRPRRCKEGTPSRLTVPTARSDASSRRSSLGSSTLGEEKDTRLSAPEAAASRRRSVGPTLAERRSYGSSAVSPAQVAASAFWRGSLGPMASAERRGSNMTQTKFLSPPISITPSRSNSPAARLSKPRDSTERKRLPRRQRRQSARLSSEEVSSGGSSNVSDYDSSAIRDLLSNKFRAHDEEAHGSRSTSPALASHSNRRKGSPRRSNRHRSPSRSRSSKRPKPSPASRSPVSSRNGSTGSLDSRRGPVRAPAPSEPSAHRPHETQKNPKSAASAEAKSLTPFKSHCSEVRARARALPSRSSSPRDASRRGSSATETPPSSSSYFSSSASSEAQSEHDAGFVDAVSSVLGKYVDAMSDYVGAVPSSMSDYVGAAPSSASESVGAVSSRLSESAHSSTSVVDRHSNPFMADPNEIPCQKETLREQYLGMSPAAVLDQLSCELCRCSQKCASELTNPGKAVFTDVCQRSILRDIFVCLPHTRVVGFLAEHLCPCARCSTDVEIDTELVEQIRERLSTSVEDRSFYNRISKELLQSPALIPKECDIQIKKDLMRTGSPLLRASETAQLYRMLRAVAHTHPTILYCQGFNSIGAFLLRFLTEELSFYGMCALIASRSPKYFAEPMKYSVCETRTILKHMLSQFPALVPNFEDIPAEFGIPGAGEWFIAMFCTTLPPKAVVVVLHEVIVSHPNLSHRENAKRALRSLFRGLPGTNISAEQMAGNVPGIEDNCLHASYVLFRAAQALLRMKLGSILTSQSDDVGVAETFRLLGRDIDSDLFQSVFHSISQSEIKSLVRTRRKLLREVGLDIAKRKSGRGASRDD